MSDTMTDENRCEPGPRSANYVVHVPDDTDGAPAETVLAALTRCFLSWRSDARVLGNVRAGDAVRAIREMWGKANSHITPPATVAALVEALEEAGKFIADYEGMVGQHISVGVSVRAALALYRGEAGR